MAKMVMDYTTGEMVEVPDNKPKAQQANPVVKTQVQPSTPKLGAQAPAPTGYATPELKHVAGGQQMWDTATARSNQANIAASQLPGQYLDQAGAAQTAAQNRQFVNQIGQYMQNIGQGPSVAEQQLGQGMEQALAQQLALAASQRGGGNVGLQQRQLAENQANVAQNVNAQAALLRAQENQANQQLMMQGLGLQSQVGQSQQGLDQAMAQAVMQQQLGLGQLGLGYSGLQAQLSDAQLRAMLGRYQSNASRSAAADQAQGQMIGGIIGGLGTLGAGLLKL